MTRTTAYVLGMVVCGLIAGVCLAAGVVQREIVRAQQAVVSQNYSEAKATLDGAERYLEYGSRLPWIGDGPLMDVRARAAALNYWQQQYSALVTAQADPLAAIPPDNIELQLVVASAVYRIGQAKATDRRTMLQALDAGIAGYTSVLKNTDRNEEAAYNYEYLVRLRNDIVKGRLRQLPADSTAPFGHSGAPPAKDDMKDFKVYIPLEPEERVKAGEAGKAAPKQRKG